MIAIGLVSCGREGSPFDGSPEEECEQLACDVEARECGRDVPSTCSFACQCADPSDPEHQVCQDNCERVCQSLYDACLIQYDACKQGSRAKECADGAGGTGNDENGTNEAGGGAGPQSMAGVSGFESSGGSAGLGQQTGGTLGLAGAGPRGRSGAGGTGGSKATGGTGGMTAMGGRGGTGGAPANPSLGKACADGGSCGTLACVTDERIAGGLCTAECNVDQECERHGPLAACFGGMCFQGCTSSALGTKCQGREDMACRAYQAIEGAECRTNAQCNLREHCIDGVCLEPLTACLPSCASDADCSGSYCDLRTGACISQPPPGLPLGAPCDPSVVADSDPCQGLCIRISDTAGVCSGLCRFTPTVAACGFGADAAVADAACVFATVLQPNPGEGDAGFCGQLCDCDADCLHPDFKCLAWGGGTNIFGRRGGCSTVVAGEETLPSCANGGSGNAGEGGAGGSE